MYYFYDFFELKENIKNRLAFCDNIFYLNSMI